jgi:hypothetical protein
VAGWLDSASPSGFNLEGEANMKTETYNGWKNYATWNVALYIQNVEPIYNEARQFDDYDKWITSTKRLYADSVTPDGVRWNDPQLDRKALNEMLAEL